MPGSPTGWWRQVPNILTLLRLAITVVFFVVLGWGLPSAEDADSLARWGNAAVTLFIVAALTDVLDGWLARRWNAVTAFGRVMDACVDKVMVLGAFTYLASLPSFASGPLGGPMDTGWTAWMTVVLLARELLVTSLRGWLEGLGVPFPADPVGKVKMLLQSVAVPMCLVVAVHAGAAESEVWRWSRDGIAWATVVATVISAIPYVVRAVRVAPPGAS